MALGQQAQAKQIYSDNAAQPSVCPVLILLTSTVKESQKCCMVQESASEAGLRQRQDLMHVE